ncbi:MAG: hypothetical protein A2V81_04560 [Candidatus Abawacabacteria bacterium RBG_16_42_10]|uniref:Pseudouridine synthase RsuA/RluA-like domain-containing protein n=1 Tax=Candidatus Abawacabacteria bacterium RBG_16_42_10 TaxID=1817814 RepID=A0A1F4XKY9_9BACT|nr:MAG: hypothetical protein A2V81_04560 [Candidatus Abawacabacteria bacterium RBG_16_42_10]
MSKKLFCKRKKDYLMVFKPVGQATTPGKDSNSLVEEVFKKFPRLKKVSGFAPEEGGLLYRLDTDTSGLVLFACTNKAFHAFRKASYDHEIEKHYLALVKGNPKKKEGEITLEIAHHPKSASKMVVKAKEDDKKRGKWRPAKTQYKVIKKVKGNSLVEAIIYQGARHQIRAHMAAIGYPLLNDPLYAKKPVKNKTFDLTCAQVSWPAKKLIFDLKELKMKK